MHFHSEKFDRIIIVTHLCSEIGVPQLQNHPYKPFLITHFPLQYIFYLTSTIPFTIDLSNADIHLFPKEFIERTDKWQQIFPAEYVALIIDLSCAVPEESEQSLTIESDLDGSNRDAFRFSAFEDAFEGVEHSNNYISLMPNLCILASNILPIGRPFHQLPIVHV